MLASRERSTATLLRDGRVLFAGGHGIPRLGGINGPLFIAELYDPATDSWTPTGEMQRDHAHHTATLLTDGRVLVAGGRPYGFGSRYESSAEIYDPHMNGWTGVASMSTPRSDHGAVLLADGRVLVAGGASASGEERLATYPILTTTTAMPNGASASGEESAATADPALASAEIYDPATDRWTAAAPMRLPRSGAGPFTVNLVRLKDGRVFVGGGYGGTDRNQTPATSEIYDPVADRWTDAPMSPLLYELPVSIEGIPPFVVSYGIEWAGRLPDGRVLGLALTPTGWDAHSLRATGHVALAALYDPVANCWQALAVAGEPDEGAAWVMLADGRVLASGGTIAGSPPISGSSFLFDVQTGLWTPTGTLPEPRRRHQAVLLAAGRVLIAGGQTRLLPTDVLSAIFTPEPGTWSR